MRLSSCLRRGAVAGAIALAVAAVASAAPPAAKPAVRIKDIQAKLVYSSTGTLSPDITSREFTIWNTIIGEGSALEPADDILVFAVLGDTDGQDNLKLPLSMIAKDGTGKTLAQRRFDGILTDHNGQTTRSIYLQDVGCIGKLVITATIGRSMRTKTLSMDCGE